MNTKLLRQKVLDLAIHGKLVPQNPEHEPASKLLERIRGESLPLATACKPSSATPSPRGKAPKTPSAPISEDEIPFEIPENWCWCRFSDYTINRDSERKPVASKNRKEVKKIYDYYGATGVVDKIDNFLFDDTLLLISEDGANLLSRSKNNAFIASGKYWVNNHAHVIDCNYKESLKYIACYINSLILDEYVTGSAQPKLTQNALSNMYLPLPPLEEQKLIVEEIERIFALIDTVEQNKTDLETVIKQTKSKILDLAIHGKLVPQDKADEPASKMLEKLRAEKEEKIAKGQLKRDKNDSYIYKSVDGKWLERKTDGTEEDIEVPFEIPESWSWCRLPTICRRSITDGTHNSPPTSDKGDYLYVTAKNIKLSGIDLSNVSYVSKEIHDVIYGRCPVELNDVLLTKDGTIGEVTVNNLDYPFSLLSSVALIKPSNIVESWFITYVLKSDYMQNIMKGSSKGVALKRIILEQINQLLIPIPPLEEQKRIFFHIKKILEILNKIN